MEKMTRKYDEVLNIIENSRRFEKRPGVEIAGIMLKQLGQPQEGLPYIHVAGTNGKGSTCAFLNSILTEAGLKVGVFSSPHLIDFEERIAIGDRLIAKEDVTRLGNQLLDIDFGVTPTMFDYCMVMSVLYFKEQKCDIAIMETGLGGRLDSTNALGVPEAVAIAKIGFDHMAFLGNDLASIASEKAGIIKPGAFTVIETQQPTAMEVFKETIKTVGGMDYQLVDESDIEYVRGLGIRMAGVHQWENGALAMHVAKYILTKHFPDMTADKMTAIVDKGLKNAFWSGRLEVLSQSPFVLVDGAHNGNGVEALKKSLITMYPGEKFHFFMGVMADKDYPEMVEQLLDIAEDFVTVTPNSSRALQANELADFIRAKGIAADDTTSVEDVITLFKSDGRNIVFGSLYFIGELKAKYDKEEA